MDKLLSTLEDAAFAVGSLPPTLVDSPTGDSVRAFFMEAYREAEAGYRPQTSCGFLDKRRAIEEAAIRGHAAGKAFIAQVA